MMAGNSVQRKRIYVQIFCSDDDSETDKNELEHFFKAQYNIGDGDLKVMKKECVEDIKVSEEIADRYDFFFFVFLTTMKEGLLELDSTRKVTVGELVGMNIGVKGLRLKPKVYLIQACDQEKLDYKGDDNPLIVSRKIPTDSDRLVILSTVPRKVAQNPPTEGGIESRLNAVSLHTVPSFLVKAFIEVMNQKSGDDMLTKTIQMVAYVDECIQRAHKVKKHDPIIVKIILVALNKSTGKKSTIEDIKDWIQQNDQSQFRTAIKEMDGDELSSEQKEHLLNAVDEGKVCIMDVHVQADLYNIISEKKEKGVEGQNIDVGRILKETAEELMEKRKYTNLQLPLVTSTLTKLIRL